MFNLRITAILTVVSTALPGWKNSEILIQTSLINTWIQFNLQLKFIGVLCRSSMSLLFHWNQCHIVIYFVLGTIVKLVSLMDIGNKFQITSRTKNLVTWFRRYGSSTVEIYTLHVYGRDPARAKNKEIY